MGAAGQKQKAEQSGRCSHGRLGRKGTHAAGRQPPRVVAERGAQRGRPKGRAEHRGRAEESALPIWEERGTALAWCVADRWARVAGRQAGDAAVLRVRASESGRAHASRPVQAGSGGAAWVRRPKWPWAAGEGGTGRAQTGRFGLVSPCERIGPCAVAARGKQVGWTVCGGRPNQKRRQLGRFGLLG